MKIKTTVHVHYTKWKWEDKGRYDVFPCKFADEEFRTYVGEQEIEIDVPDNYDPRAQQIASLEKEKQMAVANYQKSVTEINERISNLQALEYTA